MNINFRAGGIGSVGGVRRCHISDAPKGYVAGVGRGAAGFTTRSDIGPMASSKPNVCVGVDGTPIDGSGSRAAELRAVKLKMKALQQKQQHVGPATPSPFGTAPSGYIPGSGRGAGFRRDNDVTEGGPTGGGEYDSFGGYNDKLFNSTPYDDDDEEADRIYDAIDERMSGKKRSFNGLKCGNEVNSGFCGLRVGNQFRELKGKLADVTEDEWAAIPVVGDNSLRYKQKRREDVFTPITDSLLESRNRKNSDMVHLGVTKFPGKVDWTVSKETISASNMSVLADARGTILGMSLDKMSDSVSGQTVVDPKGYLTSLSNTKIATNAEVGDINKARLLLKSVRDTNPKHGPGWIAAARVEEAAGKSLQARKLIQEGCEACPQNEDLWLEAARLHHLDMAKAILSKAVRKIPTSVKIFLRAADLESNDAAKKIVLRKALETNPSSVTLWKAAIELEDAEEARILLSVAVEKVPHSIEMWLALARLETYTNSKKVLNKARRTLPADRSVWIAAAKLEESQNHTDMVDRIVDRAVKSLAKHDAIVSRTQWLKDAEVAEASGAPLTSAAIVKYTVGLGVDSEDRQRTWSDDASGALSRNAVATGRAILAHSLSVFPSKRSLWMQAVDLERKYGNAVSLDEVLAAASERLPRQEIFWLIRAKEKWLSGGVDIARDILTQAFAANPNSEPVWLAAAKLEWETGEIERARVLLQRARERASSDRVYMKSALLERVSEQIDDALNLIEEGVSLYPNFPKLWMMGGQICSDDLDKSEQNVERARNFYKRGLQHCPDNTVLWILASRLEERAPIYKRKKNLNGGYKFGFTKARSFLELSRLRNPNNPELWLEAIQLERRAGNENLAVTLMSRALQECPLSGILLAETILTAPKMEQKSKSADAIKKCPDDPHIIVSIASLFAIERKQEKARKWFERSVVLNPDLGDSWANYYAFELNFGTKKDQDRVKERCISADPKHGALWCSVTKDLCNHRKKVFNYLELVVNKIQHKAK